MREIINPYYPERIPESKKTFFGQEALTIWVEQQFIARRRVLILHGPQKIGKTTFLHFLPDMLSADHVALNFPLTKITDFALQALLTFFVQTITGQLIQQDLITPDQVTTAVDPVAAMNTILTQVRKQMPAAKILFLIDDFDRILKLEAEERTQFLDACQSLLAEQASLRFVVTCDDRAVPNLRHSFLDSAPTRQITTLKANDALQMITRPVEGVIRFDYGVTKRIAELNSNHPYYLALFNHVLFNRYAREGWVNLRHLDETLAVVIETEIPLFDAIWRESTWVERAVLASLSSVKGLHGVFGQREVIPLFLRHMREADEEVIITALESLTFRGVLVKMGALSYRFHVDLFRYWVQRHFDLETVLQDVVWKDPSARSEPAALPAVKGEDERADNTSEVRLKWPAWVVGLMGLTIVGVFALGATFLNDQFGVLDRSPAALAPAEEVVRFRVSTPAASTVTPTPEPTLTSTPTPPLVVAKTLPSIAFMARQGDNPWQIYLMNIDGSEAVPISNLVADDTSPVWSARSSELAFVSQRDGNREIYTMNVRGENLINVSNSPADDWTPAWSPDGTRIAFSSNRLGQWEIFVANPDGSDLQQVTNTGTGNISPVWSPDGEYLAFSSKRDGNWEIYSMRTDGSQLRRLTTNEVNDLAPVWSFSGDYIAYETNLEGNVEVYVMTSAGGNPRNISRLPYADDHGPVWSPDDKRLIFYSNREGNWDLFSVNLDGTNTVNLTNTPDIDEQTPAWRP